MSALHRHPVLAVIDRITMRGPIDIKGLTLTLTDDELKSVYVRKAHPAGVVYEEINNTLSRTEPGKVIVCRIAWCRFLRLLMDNPVHDPHFEECQNSHEARGLTGTNALYGD